MIAPMKRVFVVLLEKEKQKSLRELRRLGVLHVEALPGSGKVYDELSAAKASLVSAIGLLADFKAKPVLRTLGMDEGIALAAEIRQLDAAIKAGVERQVAILREMERIRPWGDFDPSLFGELASRGRPMRLVELDPRKLGTLPAGFEYIRLEQTKLVIRLLMVGGGMQELPAGCVEFALQIGRAHV